MAASDEPADLTVGEVWSTAAVVAAIERGVEEESLPVQTRQLIAIVMRFAQWKAKLVADLVASIAALWRGFDAWGDWDVASGLTAQTTVLVMEAERTVRDQTRAYMLSVTRLMGHPVQKLAPIEYAYERIGVDPFEVWQRPLVELKAKLDEAGVHQRSADEVDAEVEAVRIDDAAFEKVLNEALDRIGKMAQQDVSRVELDEAVRVMEASSRRAKRWLGYRRILHPELAKSGMSCPLCFVAATRLYRMRDLKSIHPGCNCGILPSYEGNDPGRHANDAELQRIYRETGGGSLNRWVEKIDPATGKKRRVNTAGNHFRVTIGRHGELGTVLEVGSREVQEAERFASGRRGRTDAALNALGASEDDRSRWTRMRKRAESYIETLEKRLDSENLSDRELELIERALIAHNMVIREVDLRLKKR